MATFTIIGGIKTKQRPRATVIGGYARVYTPKDTINYENYIKSEYQRQCNEFYGSKPIRAVIRAYYKAPEQLRKLTNYGLLAVCNKQDVDNLAKIVLDSLNGIAYIDDKQVVNLHVKKQYSTNEQEYIEVELEEVELMTLDDLKKNNKIIQLESKIKLLVADKKPSDLSKQDTIKLNNYLNQLNELKGNSNG